MSNELYPIRTVAALTGVSPLQLRAWERRHGLLQPRRTDSGHRLYAEGDIERVREISRLVQKGISIGRVAEALGAAPANERGPSDVWAAYRARMIDATLLFDEEGLEHAYSEALSLYPVDVVTRRLLVPLLQELGERWERAEGSVAEEHFFTMYLRNKLGARFHHRRPHRAGGIRLLAACLPGELHEIGLLLFALTAHDRGCEPLLLGANLPLEEIPAVARRTACEAIVLCGTVDPAPAVWSEQLPGLTRALRMPVFVGGAAAARHGARIRRAGAIALDDDIASGLQSIAARLRPSAASHFQEGTVQGERT